MTRYADVLAALRDPALSAVAAQGGEEPCRAEHLRFRAEGLAAVSAQDTGKLPALPQGDSADLVGSIAQPWSAAVALRLLPPRGEPSHALALAHEIFAAAADPLNSAFESQGREAARELAVHFPGSLSAIHVQGFVALSQTLPCFLASAWLVLLNHPKEMQTLRDTPELMSSAIEELLRLAGPARVQFRHATRPLQLSGTEIRPGDPVALMLAEANRDPERFPDPDRLDLRRDAAGHFAFGAGPHACIGAPLIRSASAAATAAFVESFAGARVESVEWSRGFAICAPVSLRVSTSPSSARRGIGPCRSSSARTLR